MGERITEYLTVKDLVNTMLVSKGVYAQFMKWGNTARTVILKMRSNYVGKLRLIEAEILKEQQQRERLKKGSVDV